MLSSLVVTAPMVVLAPLLLAPVPSAVNSSSSLIVMSFVRYVIAIAFTATYLPPSFFLISADCCPPPFLFLRFLSKLASSLSRLTSLLSEFNKSFIRAS